MTTVASPDPRLDPWRDRLVGLDAVTGSVLVACSGGADSLATLVAARDAGLETTALHVDHGLRPGSEREAAHVATQAARVGARFQCAAVRVDAGPNLEARARDARYEVLEEARVALGATAVLVGHTADDQAETLLLNLLRGSASPGLGAMAAQRGTLVRPILRLRRHDTEAICAAFGLEPLHDPMNDDRSLRRVRVRQELLPLLDDIATRDVVPVLTRQADVLRADSEYLDELARSVWPPGPDATPAATLARLPLPLARRAVRQWLGSPPPSLAEVERILAVAQGRFVATELTGGRRVTRRGGQLVLVCPESSVRG